VHRDATCIAFLTKRQVRPYETLVVPREHVDHIVEVSSEVAMHLFEVANRIMRSFQKNLPGTRAGLLIHGFGISHAHIIVIPQHEHTDIVSGRHASIEDGQVVFSCDRIPEVPRSDLNSRASELRAWIEL